MNSFYTPVSLQAAQGTLRCILTYNAENRIFEGHFPGNPIVPGVCTMAIVKELLEGAVNRRLQLRDSKNVKFLGLINPAMQPELQLSWTENDGLFQVNATISGEQGALFKMAANYAAM